MATCLFAATLVGGFGSVANASTGDVLVYTGNSGFGDVDDYDDFAASTGKDVTVVFSALPADLSVYDCVLLPGNSDAFDSAQLQRFLAYVADGGRLVAMAELGADAFQPIIANMNSIASAVGADISVVSDSLDLGWTDTTNIDPSPFTAGVDAVTLGGTSRLSVGPDASSLVRTSTTNDPFIAVDPIGTGYFFLMGDSSVLNDNNDGYANADNGVLARNMCDGVSLDITTPTDSDGDGVPDVDDACAGRDDTVDVDGDGIPDGCDDFVDGDTDGDGVPNSQDLCPTGTVLDWTPAQQAYGSYYLESGVFVSDNWRNRPYTLSDMDGCDPLQIIQEAELGQGHRRTGLSPGAALDWYLLVND